MARPFWSLAVVQSLVARDRFLLATQTAADYFDSAEEARDVAQACVARLGLANFSRTTKLARHRADIYGVVYDGRGFYLKLTIVDVGGPEVLVISFHPLEHPLRTNGGMVMP